MKKRRIWILIAVVAFGAYVASYFAVMSPVTMKMVDKEGQVVKASRIPAYVIGDEFSETAKFVFQPIEWLDRKVRPAYWHPIADEPQRHEDGSVSGG